MFGISLLPTEFFTRLSRTVAFVLAVAWTAPPGQAISQRVDSAGVEIVLSRTQVWKSSSRWLVSQKPVLSIGQAEAEAEYTFSRIVSVLRLFDGNVAVADGSLSTLRFYDSKGKYLSSFGRRGDGPNEFAYILGMWLTPEGQVAVYSSGSRVTVVKGLGASAEQSVFRANSPFVVIHAGLGDAYLTSTPTLSDLGGQPRTILSDTQIFAIRDGKGDKATQIVRVPGQQRIIFEFDRSIRYPFLPFSIPPSATATSSMAFIGQGTMPEVRVFAGNARLIRIIRWVPGNTSMTDKARRHYATSILDREARSRSLAAWRRFVATVPYPKEVPAYQKLLLDSDGNLWAEEFRIDRAAQGKWSVFNKQGLWLGRVIMPAGLRVTQIGADYVAGASIDEWGVERAVIHALAKS